MVDVLYNGVLWLLGFLMVVPALLVGLVVLGACLGSADVSRSRKRLSRAHCRSCGAQFGRETVRLAEKSLQGRAEEIQSAYPNYYVNFHLYLELRCPSCGEISRRKP